MMIITFKEYIAVKNTETSCITYLGKTQDPKTQKPKNPRKTQWVGFFPHLGRVLGSLPRAESIKRNEMW